MLRSLNVAATGMQAQTTNMDVVANNLANVSTVGFKKARAEFEDLMYQTHKEPGAATGINSYSPTGIQTGSGVRTSAVQKDFLNGSALITKNALDLQIEGAGFFAVQTPDGQVGYTRDGAFKKDQSGKIVDKNGNPLQPEVVIPPNATGIEISSSGEVRISKDGAIAPESVGQIELFQFVNPAGLKSIGKNLFAQTGSSGQPIQGRPGLNSIGFLAQGQLESSNVSIVDEMVNMITSQRAYETNSKVMQAADQMLQTTNNLR